MERIQDPGTPGFYSRLFLVPKKNGQLHPIIALSILDQVFQFTALSFGMALSMDFHQTNGRNSSTLASTCHLVTSISRQLADKGSDLQLTSISRNLLPSNCTKSRFHSKSKGQFDTSPEIHIYRHGISDTTKYSQGTSRPS